MHYIIDGSDTEVVGHSPKRIGLMPGHDAVLVVIPISRVMLQDALDPEALADLAGGMARDEVAAAVRARVQELRLDPDLPADLANPEKGD